jgi:hypothetical protein
MRSYEDRFDTVVTHVWESWTNNGLGLDDDMNYQTVRSVQDAATNAYLDGISDTDWYARALARLNQR